MIIRRFSLPKEMDAFVKSEMKKRYGTDQKVFSLYIRQLIGSEMKKSKKWRDCDV